MGDKFRFRHLLSRAARRCSSSAGCKQDVGGRCRSVQQGPLQLLQVFLGQSQSSWSLSLREVKKPASAISGETGEKPHSIRSFTSPCFSFIQNLSGFLEEAIAGLSHPLSLPHNPLSSPLPACASVMGGMWFPIKRIPQVPADLPAAGQASLQSRKRSRSEAGADGSAASREPAQQQPQNTISSC